ncbi:unnamed protein product [Ilex paraguariensis]|uniref:Uncharacterized protein n=1 Tax=Ilex paraguariensis TaxID=185542 RepID=A0ABC8UEC8_9AQUA
MLDTGKSSTGKVSEEEEDYHERSINKIKDMTQATDLGSKLDWKIQEPFGTLKKAMSSGTIEGPPRRMVLKTHPRRQPTNLGCGDYDEWTPDRRRTQRSTEEQFGPHLRADEQSTRQIKLTLVVINYREVQESNRAKREDKKAIKEMPNQRIEQVAIKYVERYPNASEKRIALSRKMVRGCPKMEKLGLVPEWAELGGIPIETIALSPVNKVL